MRRRWLGPDDLHVGEIGLGCMSMSWAYLGEAPEDESIRVIHPAAFGSRY